MEVFEGPAIGAVSVTVAFLARVFGVLVSDSGSFGAAGGGSAGRFRRRRAESLAEIGRARNKKSPVTGSRVGIPVPGCIRIASSWVGPAGPRSAGMGDDGGFGQEDR